MGIGSAEGIAGQRVGEMPGVLRRIRLHAMAQHVKPRIRNQPLGKLRQKLRIQNRILRPQLPIHQRMLHPVVGQNGKIRHLRAGAGGGRDRCQRHIQTGKIDHGLGAVHSAAAAQRRHQIGGEPLHRRRTLHRQLHRGIGGNLMEDLKFLRLRRLRYPLGSSVFIKEGVGHQKDPFCP